MITFAGLLLAITVAAGPEGLDCALWDGPGGKHAFCLTPGSRDGGMVLAVYAEHASQGWGMLFRDRDRGHHPWKILTAELDGDPLPEVAVICLKTTPRDPVPQNRLQVWDWDGHRLFPLWLGSRLGAELVDAAFVAGPDGRDRLLSLERDGDRAVMLRRWAWNGFGFNYEIDLARVDRPRDPEEAVDRLRRRMEELKRGK